MEKQENRTKKNITIIVATNVHKRTHNHEQVILEYFTQKILCGYRSDDIYIPISLYPLPPWDHN